MEQNREERKFVFRLDPKIVIGILVIIAGVLFLLDNLGLELGFTIWELWPVILIVLGLSLMARPSEERQMVTGLILLAIGLIFLFDNLEVIPYGIGEFWPVILILVGILIIKNAVWGLRGAPMSEDFVNLSFVLGGGDFRFNTKKFKGGKVSAIMGGGTVDLREAEMEQEKAVIDTFAIMGGIEIKVPETWEVSVQGTPIMGGIDNKARLNNSAVAGKQTKKLIIKGSAIMGGVEIKN
ncbi:MAG: hypothetical protein JXB26_04095 [Candidatus Aminicenantes bacterium]|nr:hypothetical protein [Candidatus Aminicenantes bacterium]